MADKITRQYKASASGLLTVDKDNQIYISTEDNGDVNLAKLLIDFSGKGVKLSCSYDEDYIEEEIKVDLETGEII